ncbi:hypothetical protein MHBO_000925 [Bonamia ostreae]|uniref:Uncharacterized protein n=1 Tax=Bonamia ostreae TaxID=126728 RepID=A0ABV2AHA4_9EUKA
MSSSDFLNAERNLGLRNVLNSFQLHFDFKEKNEQILFSDILSIKVFSDFKSNINTFADKTVLITNKVLWVFEQCTKFLIVILMFHSFK